MNPPPLMPLHPDATLLPLKLDAYHKLTTPVLIDSLRPGQIGALKARADGTVLDGHHRIKVLRERGIAVDALPREVIPRLARPDDP